MTQSGGDAFDVQDDGPHGGGWLAPAKKYQERRAATYPSTERDREAVRVHFRLRAELLDRLTEHSLSTGLTRTAIVQRALHSWLEEQGS